MPKRGRLDRATGQAAMPGLAMTVTIQRVGLLDLTSITERTNPVTRDPFSFKVVFWPRCWSYRQRLATFGSVVWNVCMRYKSRHAKRFRDVCVPMQR
jgi:hypothetical protein